MEMTKVLQAAISITNACLDPIKLIAWECLKGLNAQTRRSLVPKDYILYCVIPFKDSKEIRAIFGLTCLINFAKPLNYTSYNVVCRILVILERT